MERGGGEAASLMERGREAASLNWQKFSAPLSTVNQTTATDLGGGFSRPVLKAELHTDLLSVPSSQLLEIGWANSEFLPSVWSARSQWPIKTQSIPELKFEQELRMAFTNFTEIIDYMGFRKIRFDHISHCHHQRFHVSTG
jgi:hypothetical protein